MGFKMKYRIQKITSCVVDDKGDVISGTEFVHYQIVDTESGCVVGVSQNIDAAVAILNSLQKPDVLKDIIP
jgi:hypothetical protein